MLRLVSGAALLTECLLNSFGCRSREAKITKARNDWKEQPHGDVYKSRLVHLLGRNPTADLDTAGAQVESKFRAALEAAEARSGQAAGGAGKGIKR